VLWFRRKRKRVKRRPNFTKVESGGCRNEFVRENSLDEGIDEREGGRKKGGRKQSKARKGYHPSESELTLNLSFSRRR
jgi:hypothetical protein